MKIKWKVSVAALLVMLTFSLSGLQTSAQAANPSLTIIGGPDGMGIAEGIAYWLRAYAEHLASIGVRVEPNGEFTSQYIQAVIKFSEKVGPETSATIGHADRILPIVGGVIAVLRVIHAGVVAKKHGKDFGDAAVDNMIAQGSWGLSPGYVETNKAVTDAFVKLGNDRSLEGSYLYNSVQQLQNQSAQQAKDSAAKRRAAEEELGKELYGKNYQLPAGYAN